LPPITAAIVAIFLPVAFMKGIIGKFFFQFGVTISVSVLLSLLEALTLTPMRCSRFLEVGGRQGRVAQVADRAFGRVAAGYERWLGPALHHRGWVLAGSAVFAHEGQPCRLDYRIVLDADFRTRSAMVRGWLGEKDIDVTIEADAGRWRLNGVECPQVEGCIDVDLNFSPSTNLLPIRRLDLPIGDEAEVRAAWLRFPDFVLEPLPQVYHRTGERAYH
jgi:hypothetical protein